MSHARQQLREAFATAVTGLTTTGSRVHQSMVIPIDPDNGAALRVYTLDEALVESTTTQPRTQYRRLQIICEGVAKAASGLDDTLDTIAAEVEAAIAADVTLGGLCKDCFLEATEIEINGDTEKPAGVARMTWLCDYAVKENDAETLV